MSKLKKKATITKAMHATMNPAISLPFAKPSTTLSWNHKALNKRTKNNEMYILLHIIFPNSIICLAVHT